MASSIDRTAALAIVACFLVAQVSALSLQQVKKMTQMPRQICMQKTGASKDMVEKIQQGEFADDPKLKCYVKCCLGMMQAMKKDVYNAESAISQAEKLLPDTHKERVKVAIQKCQNEGAGLADACEMAVAITKCNYDTDPEVFVFP